MPTACLLRVDAVEKVFFGWSTKILKTADALRARRPEDPHRLIQKRPPAFVLAPENLVAAAVSKKRLSRDFRCHSIFDFFDSIGHSRRFRHVRLGRAGSTGRRNTGVKSLCWGFKLQGLTWSFI